ncbi:AlkA N-terminal domain-containing protein [Hydrogenophaga sp.]|uniref:DNA-3-methyladenine glycosylase 2 family protein n=1 Tax=Hydrogenophaga sp. TaxID=1904254 RepID=UPI0025C61825|nr:AlkA N-terminal domain-containing protein [Hydrogenophaga sp.]
MDHAARHADEVRYRALAAHDARFDGRFFVGVTSTGIYCRPVCRVRLPRRENCRFFDHAAQAEGAGFRPCLRCRPELAPLDRHWSNQDACSILVREATKLLDAPASWALPDCGSPLLALAQRLGVSDRHLRRAFEHDLGVSPLQYLQTRRLLAAKQLLADTRLSVHQVAQMSGFGSVRRFNAAFQARYGLSPRQLRPTPRSKALAPTDRTTCTARLGWRPPYDEGAMLAFLATRQLPGVERVDSVARLYARTFSLSIDGASHTGWLQAHFKPEANEVTLELSAGLQAAIPHVLWRVRAMFDLDADPQAINASLHRDFPACDGLRVPGCMDGFELAVRAVLGQQITVAAARTLAARLIERFGEALITPVPQLTRLFPAPQALAQADPAEMGALGIVRQRQAAIQALARAVCDGSLDLSDQADIPASVQALQQLPGIGPWTAQYIALRALRWPDAWPPGDVAVHAALGLSPLRGRLAEQAAALQAAAWQPWRGYAVIRAWAGCHRSAHAPSSESESP